MDTKKNKENILPVLRDFLKETKDDWNYITPEEYKKMRNKGGADDYFLLDIRKKEDFDKGHIPGAKNIFWMDILKPENLEKLPKNKKILIYCYVGHTSSQVLVLLKLLGYDVVSLKFGIGKSPVEGVPVAGWSDFGYKTTKKGSTMNKLSSMLDDIATRLEKECLFKEAEELDVISNTIDRYAAAQPTPEQMKALKFLKQHDPGKDAEFIEDKGELKIKFTNPKEQGGVWKDEIEIVEPNVIAIKKIIGY